jgi:hypothetical protein
MKKIISGIVGACALIWSVQSSQATVIDWVNWDSYNSTTVNGTLAGGSNAVTYSGELGFAQINGVGTDWWGSFPGVYTNATVSNSPSSSDMIAISGNGTTNTVTFAAPVTNLVMGIISLGQANPNTEYHFNTPFTVLSDGPAYWGSPGTLNNLGGNVLQGIEGDGIIQFSGPISSLSWSTSDGEYWNGFSFGAPVSAPVPEPGTLLLLGAGLAGLGLVRRRAKR